MKLIGPRTLVDVGHGIAFPETIEFLEILDNDTSLNFQLEVRFSHKLGRYQLKTVVIEPLEDEAEINGLLIRRIQFQELLQSCLTKLHYFDIAQKQLSLMPAASYIPTDRSDLVKRGPSIENLQEVAKLHRIATVLNLGQGKHLQSVLQIPYPTAANWIARARKQGLILDAGNPNLIFPELELSKHLVPSDFLGADSLKQGSNDGKH